MSFNFSFTAPDKETAKNELCERNTADGGNMPENVKQAVQALIDAMPDPPQGNMFNVSSYGHVATGEDTSTSNVTVDVSHVIA